MREPVLLVALYLLAFAIRAAGMHPLMTGGDPHDRMRESVEFHRLGFHAGERSLFAGGGMTGRPQLYAALLAAGYHVQGRAGVEQARWTGFAVTALVAPLGYALVLRLSRARAAAILAGLALATASLLVKEAGELNYAAFVPVFFLAALERLHAFLETRRLRDYAFALAAAVAAAYCYTPAMAAALVVAGTGLWTLRLRALPFLAAVLLVFAIFPYDVLGRGYARYFSEGSRAVSTGFFELLVHRVRVTYRFMFPSVGESWEAWPWLAVALAWTLPGLAFLSRTWATGLLLGIYWSPYLVLPPIFPGAIAAVAAPLIVLLFTWLGLLRARAPRLGTPLLAVAAAGLLAVAAQETIPYLRAVRENPAAVFPLAVDARPLSAWIAKNLPQDSRIGTRSYEDQLYFELPPSYTVLGVGESVETPDGARLRLDEVLALPEAERTALLARAVDECGVDYLLIPSRDEGVQKGFTHAVEREILRLAPALGARIAGQAPVRVGGAEIPVTILRTSRTSAPGATPSRATGEGAGG